MNCSIWNHGVLHRSVGVRAIALLSLVLVSCGPNKTEECRELLSLIQQSETQRALGEYDRAAQVAELQRLQALVDDLVALPIQHQKLQDHQTKIIEAYESLIVATNQYLEASDEEGHLSYLSGDAEAEAEVNTIQAQQMQAHHRINLETGLFYTTCSN